MSAFRGEAEVLAYLSGLLLVAKSRSSPFCPDEPCSMTWLREKLVKIGAKVVSHGRYVTFQLAEVAVSRELFRKILRLIDGLRPAPLPP